jgi:hypothetical protein
MKNRRFSNHTELKLAMMNYYIQRLLVGFATWLDHMSWTDCDRAWWHTRSVCSWFYRRYLAFCYRFDVVSAEYGGRDAIGQ